jgi:mannose-1-phosphate guanylyltransferase/mannose-6-phosphate isomerase
LSNIIPVILSGGSGTRLWPLSRKQHPKQYLSLFSDKTLLQETILRLNGLDNLLDPIIICNTEHRFLVVDQLQEIGIYKPTIILEPVGRNTAPAVAAAAFQVVKDCSSESILLVLSADHIIQDIPALHNAINIAVEQAKQDKLTTFGVVPNSPNTGYGYIQLSTSISEFTYQVERFIEKPDLKSAESYLKSGEHLWNSGMFMFKAEVFINELSLYGADIISAVRESSNNAQRDLDFIRLEKESFELSPNDSIDFALMEKSKNVIVVTLDAGWSDIGSWSSLYDVMEKTEDGNVIEGDVFTEKTFNSFINANHHMVATIGVEDLIIIDTPNATLIANRDHSQDIKKILNQLIDSGRQEQNYHRKVFRPWGWYDSIESGLNFQVKRLCINPYAKLSLQLHHKRAEHWVVVKGTASVINGNQSLSLESGQSTYIPVGIQHSLENKTDKLLEVIEVQSGHYLGEDDIVRFEDIYGRIKE